MSHDDVRNPRTFGIATDLLVADGYDKVPVRGRPTQWKPLFMPKLFVEEHKEITLDEFRLKEQQFRQHGEQISEFREELRQQALGHDKLTAELLQKRLIEVSRVA